VFRIKICGITTTEDAQQAARAGADAVGLNFYPGSPRFLSVTQARDIAAAATDRVAKVGVFVNADSDRMLDLAETVGLDMIQLHGDEPSQTLQRLSDYPVIKAFRCRRDGLEPVLGFLKQCRAEGRLPDAVLLDAHAPGKYGGTGQCIDWPAVRGAQATIGGVPVVLAGGLTAENVAQAIVEARPAAVDTAGGVELSPGMKDPNKMNRFVAAAEAAFRQVDSRSSGAG
jgi:phosphoribosylanthranilate isomerase